MSGPYIPAGYGDDTLNSATLPPGMVLGMKKMSKDGLTELTLVQAAAAVGPNKMVKMNGAGFQVIPTIAATDIGFGCNDRTGGTVASANYFWAATRFYMSPLVAAGVAQFANVCPSAVSGQLAANGATNNNQMGITAQVASGSGGATLCYKD